jgi:DNA-binding response OmpR family regulator
VDARILVVEDDLTVAEVVVEYLRHAGMEARHAVDGPAGLEIAAAWPPDLVVLDLMLPGLSGLEVCRRLREERGAQSPPLPVIMLTALTEESDRVLGLESGADDYVTKPFSPRELTLRVQAVLRRARTVDAAAATPHLVRSGRLEVDVAARRARRDGEELELTVREFDLLAFFVSNPGRAFTRAQLLEQVWGYSFGDQSTVTVYVRRLRDKVEPEPAAPAQLQTVWGVGYRWEAGSS